MGESQTRRARASKAFKEHLFHKSQLSPYGRAAVALWPDNAPKVIAERADCSVRNANQFIRGERGPSPRAILAVLQEIA